jgi:hypothetical protein
MTREQAKTMLPIIVAFSEGKKIQVNVEGQWCDREELQFYGPINKFRIKPEPRKFWVCGGFAWDSKQPALDWALTHDFKVIETVEVVEVAE